jgi:SAM-dependent methyltransferase
MKRNVYLFKHGWEQEYDRLELLQQTFDPTTLAYLEALPVSAGGRCLEIGGGAGSIARWMCRRVGPVGQVVATDIEPDFLELLSEDNLEVRRHDVAVDDVEERAFDLIHARLVLSHLPERDLILRRLVAALRPDGWLVIEEFDYDGIKPAPGCVSGPLLDRANWVLMGALERTGYDREYGRRLPLEFRAVGLVDVGAEGRAPIALPGTAAADWWRLNLLKVRPALIAAGFSESEADEAIALTDHEEFCLQYPILVSTWGRRPGA